MLAIVALWAIARTRQKIEVWSTIYTIGSQERDVTFAAHRLGRTPWGQVTT